MRLIPIECIRDNTKLAKTVYDEEGRVLVNAGTILSDNIISKMNSLQIYYAYIEDTYTEEEINEVIRPQIRKKSISTIRETFSSIDRLYTKKDIGPVTYWKRKNRKYYSEIYNLAEELINEILSNSNILSSLVDIKSMDNYTYEHTVNVAVISIVIGISLKYTKEELHELALGALIHDIGKAFIPKDLSKNEKSLDANQRMLYRQHSIKGYEYATDVLGLSKNICLPILEHHENVDGTGFPKGSKGNKLHPYSKIIAIANCYDKLTSNSLEKKGELPSDALEYIMTQADKKFDYDLVQIFCHVVIPYPRGTLVRLSNNEIGLVQSTPPNYPLRPRIKIIKSSVENHLGSVVDLINNISLVIINVETSCYSS